MRRTRSSDRHMIPRLLGALLAIYTVSIVLALRMPPQAAQPAPPVPDAVQVEPPPVPQPPDPAPEPEPEPTEEALRRARAEELLADMSTHEKICQLFIVFPEAVTSLLTSAQEGLAAYPVGGLIFDRSDMKNYDQLHALLCEMQAASALPLLLTCDEEGGRVARVMAKVGTTWFDAMLTYRDQGPETAHANAQTIAQDLQALGFNLNLAPVADVWSNPANTVIGDRAYSTDFEQAAQLVAAAVSGFQDGGLACTLKHFPGHGDSEADSHRSPVYIRKTLDELRAGELLPFAAGIAAGADCVMLGHLIVEELDTLPAPLSAPVVTQLLRGELGFTGVVMTDSLQMRALTDHYSGGEIAVRAVGAGVDILLSPAHLPTAVQALTDALAAGELTQQRLDESVLRILELKLRRGIIPG